MTPSLENFFDRVRSVFTRMAAFVKAHRKEKTRSEDRSFAGVCPFCGLLTPRKGSHCLECGKSIRLA